MNQLRRWGFGPWFLSRLDLDLLSHPDGPPVGRVIAHSHGLLLLATERGQRLGTIAGRLRDSPSAPAVGDWVLLRPDTLTGDGLALVVETMERKTCFIRRDPGVGQQVVAANVDTVFITAPLGAEPNLRRLERSVVAVHQAGAEPVVLLTKADLCPDPDRLARRVEAALPGVAVRAVAALEGAGSAEALEAWLGEGATVALTGPSGAGKSTLVNALLGAERAATAEVRLSDGKGRHTTTARTLFLRPEGGILLDTPGIRELGLTEDQEGVEAAFADVLALGAQCRWRDCSHDGEPGCAITLALEEGRLDPGRWASWCKLQREAAHEARRGDIQAQMAETRRWKRISQDAQQRGRLRDRQRW